MSIRGLRLALSGGHTGPLDQFLFGGSTQSDTLFVKQTVDNSATDTQTSRDCIDALSAFVKQSNVFRWDRVVSTGHVQFSGLAFDATTSTGLYNSDGYCVHNCRCVTVPWAASRRLNVNFAAARPSRKPVVLTMHQLGEIIAQELGGVLRAT